jgi:23S rRNA (cytidine1920-2'-O)/16S rRNA (cytidine1409-2'-O)-methyltransferase
MKKLRLDQALVQRGLAATRSQAEHYIKLGYVQLDGKTVIKAGQSVGSDAKLSLSIKQQYVSRAALKLDSVAAKLGLVFKGKVVLDVGSSTGGFTDYALKHGAAKVIAVEVGSGQMHPSLKDDKRLELHEKTDIRQLTKLSAKPDIVLIDVSFVSLRLILPAVAKLVDKRTDIVAMVKPQFEAGSRQMNKGVVKNNSIRRKILADFESWSKELFTIQNKADSSVAGVKGNLERFYLLCLTA